MPWWLKTPDGARLPIQSGGALLGRAPDSDIVLADERASRRHALVHLLGETPWVVNLGQGSTTVDGDAVTGERALSANVRIEVPGLSLAVERTAPSSDDADEPWILQRIGGGLYGLAQSPYRVGGKNDALQVDGWPPGALTFWRTGDGLTVEAGTTARVDDEDVEPGQIVRCRSGTRIEVGAVILQVMSGGGHSMASTVADNTAGLDELPQRIKLAFLPRGARLYLTDARQERAVYLPERRAELVALLLSPPEPYAAGDLIPDELMLERLWPRQTKTTNDLHVLVHRARKSLVAAGIDGASLIAREAQAGGTRFAVRKNASVAIA